MPMQRQDPFLTQHQTHTQKEWIDQPDGAGQVVVVASLVEQSE